MSSRALDRRIAFDLRLFAVEPSDAVSPASVEILVADGLQSVRSSTRLDLKVAMR